jgi:hypothetical protein
VEILQSFVDFWGNYIPVIYGLAKALLVARETDAAAAAAWSDRMDVLREGGRSVIACLVREQTLAPEWNAAEAADMLWSMLSIAVWENLTIDCGWSNSQYIAGMQSVLKQALVRDS